MLQPKKEKKKESGDRDKGRRKEKEKKRGGIVREGRDGNGAEPEGREVSVPVPIFFLTNHVKKLETSFEHRNRYRLCKNKAPSFHPLV